MTTESLNLSDLKAQSPKDLLSMAEELEIENASTMRKGEMMFQILRERADEGWEIYGDGVLEVLQDGFGFLRSPEANYLPGPDDIYVSPDMIRQYSLRTGDTIEGAIRAPNDSERYFALTNVPVSTSRTRAGPITRSRSTISRRSTPMSGFRWRYQIRRPRTGRRASSTWSRLSARASAR
jgi:transcription termination factor Rho